MKLKHDTEAIVEAVEAAEARGKDLSTVCDIYNSDCINPMDSIVDAIVASRKYPKNAAVHCIDNGDGSMFFFGTEAQIVAKLNAL